jgi:hypothetical protein
MPPTDRQVELFHKLTTDRDFGDADPDALRSTFATLTPAAASKWIDRAMSKPRATGGSAEGENIDPDF